MATLSEATFKIRNLPWPEGVQFDIAPDASEFTIYYTNAINVCKTPSDLKKFRECIDYAMNYLRKVNPACLLMIL